MFTKRHIKDAALTRATNASLFLSNWDEVLDQWEQTQISPLPNWYLEG